VGTRLKNHLFVVTLIALVAASAAIAAARVVVTVKVAHNASLNTSILVDQSGRTLYHITTDAGKTVTCTGACATIWPPLTVPKGMKAAAGSGVVKSKLGTITRPDGRTQVTYAGLTLYRYSGDAKAGQAKGEGFQKIWYATNAAGKLVKKAVSSGGGYGR
jgi:predicted lipoprotein with Yx(FWY)xxD motif